MKKRGRNHKKRNTSQAPTWGTKNKAENGYDEAVLENAEFETYYKAQKIVPDDEWETFMKHLREPLPVSFRVTGCRSRAKAVLKIIEGEYLQNLTDEDVKPQCLPWYPENLAWQLNLSKKEIRKSEVNYRLHNFLVSETEAGSISRQETVSMIPPIVLDVQPHHKVLDMCAAPGSKTTQLLEMLHTVEGKIPEGFVMANDVNNNRCYLLTHQLKRIESPSVIVVNHDASSMPTIHIPARDREGEMQLKFDRILCDVPCSGDGTMRKNLDVWTKWNAANSPGLHGLQYRIVRRGAEMLSVGGRIVYSTCSLNPIEDEAVIHRLLVETAGALKLVDASERLPGLNFSAGLSTWAVMSRDLRSFATAEEVPDDLRHRLPAWLFPPRTEDAAKFNLERCMRILPHKHNTGGFFVAVLEKVDFLPWESKRSIAKSLTVGAEGDNKGTEVEEAEAGKNEGDNKGTEGEKAEADRNSNRSSPPRKRQRFGNNFKEDPFIFFDENEPTWPRIKEFYGIADELNPTMLLTRRKDGKQRNIYMTNSIVRDIAKTNEHKLKIINTGVKVFARCDNKGTTCDFRVTQEGAMTLMPFMSNRKVTATKEDIITILSNPSEEAPCEIHTFHPDTAAQLHAMEVGSLLIEYKDDAMHFIVVVWKGQISVKAYVQKGERLHYLRLCGADISKFEVNKFANKAKANSVEGGSENAAISDNEIESKETTEDVELKPSVKTELEPDTDNVDAVKDA